MGGVRLVFYEMLLGILGNQNQLLQVIKFPKTIFWHLLALMIFVYLAIFYILRHLFWRKKKMLKIKRMLNVFSWDLDNAFACALGDQVLCFCSSIIQHQLFAVWCCHKLVGAECRKAQTHQSNGSRQQKVHYCVLWDSPWCRWLFYF